MSKKIIAVMNMTLDGVFDHTAGVPDDEIHQHYADLLANSDAVLYGRITYQMMEFWPTFAKHPSGEKAMDDFAVVMDRIPKIIFSNTLKNVDWHSANLSHQPIEELVSKLKQQPGNDILVGSRSLIIQLLKLNLIDELQLCIYPKIGGQGLPLFENLKDSTTLKLLSTKTFKGGAVILYYEPTIKYKTVLCTNLILNKSQNSFSISNHCTETQLDVKQE